MNCPHWNKVLSISFFFGSLATNVGFLKHFSWIYFLSYSVLAFKRNIGNIYTCTLDGWVCKKGKKTRKSKTGW